MEDVNENIKQKGLIQCGSKGLPRKILFLNIFAWIAFNIYNLIFQDKVKEISAAHPFPLAMMTLIVTGKLITGLMIAKRQNLEVINVDFLHKKYMARQKKM